MEIFRFYLNEAFIKDLDIPPEITITINKRVGLPCADASLISYYQHLEYLYYFKIDHEKNINNRDSITLCKYNLQDRSETEVQAYSVPFAKTCSHGENKTGKWMDLISVMICPKDILLNNLRYIGPTYRGS